MINPLDRGRERRCSQPRGRPVGAQSKCPPGHPTTGFGNHRILAKANLDSADAENPHLAHGCRERRSLSASGCRCHLGSGQRCVPSRCKLWRRTRGRWSCRAQRKGCASATHTTTSSGPLARTSGQNQQPAPRGGRRSRRRERPTWSSAPAQRHRIATTPDTGIRRVRRAGKAMRQQSLRRSSWRMTTGSLTSRVHSTNSAASGKDGTGSLRRPAACEHTVSVVFGRRWRRHLE